MSFQDPGANTSLASGLSQSSIIDNRNFDLTKPHTHPGTLLFTSLKTDAPANTNDVQTVAGILNNGTSLKGGTFTLTVSSGLLGITDVAGNPLDGEFYGYFPSGNNVPGGDFVAIIDAIHHIIASPKPNNGYASPLPSTGTLGDGLYVAPPKTPVVIPPVYQAAAAAGLHEPVARNPCVDSPRIGH